MDVPYYWPGGSAPRAATSRSAQAAPNRRVHFEDQATQESASGRDACRLRITSSNVAPRRVAARALEGTSRADPHTTHILLLVVTGKCAWHAMNGLCAHFAKLLKKPALLRGLQLRYYYSREKDGRSTSSSMSASDPGAGSGAASASAEAPLGKCFRRPFNKCTGSDSFILEI